MARSSRPSGLLFALVIAPLAGLLATGVLVFTSPILPMAWMLGVLAAPVATLTYGRFRDLPPQRICIAARVKERPAHPRLGQTGRSFTT